jgi:hypothetical protein
MEYWQIEDRFGSRPHPKLELHLEALHVGLDAYRVPGRFFRLGLTNSGAGIAKFPGVLFKRLPTLSVDSFGIDGNMNFGIRLRPSEGEWIVFGGGVDDVVYPGQTTMIAKLKQSGESVGIAGIPITLNPNMHTRHVFKEFTFKCEISCEGCPTINAEKLFPEADFITQIY